MSPGADTSVHHKWEKPPVLHLPQNRNFISTDYLNSVETGIGQHCPHTRGANQLSFCLRFPHPGTAEPQHADPNPRESCRGPIRS